VRYTQTEYVSSSVPIGGFTQEQSHLDETSHGVVANWTRAISNNKVNQLRFGWLHENVTLGGAPTTSDAYNSFGLQNIFPYASELALPYVEIRNNQYSGAGGEPNVPQIYDQPSYQLSDAFTWSKGRHSMSAGLDVRWFSGLNLTYTGIALTFDGSYTGAPFADLLVGYAAEAQAQQPTAFGPTVDTSNEVKFSAKQFNPWVQDDWKATPRLTINIGLRWDYATRPVEATDRTFWIDPNIPGGGLYVGNKKIIDEGLGGSVYEYGGQRAPGSNQYGVLAPRFGIAYRPFDYKNVIRAGYGIFYDSAESKEANGGAEYPFGLQSQAQFVKLDTVFPPSPPLQPATPAVMSFLFLTSPNLHTPTIQTWTLSLEREIFPGVKAEADYIGSKADHLLGRVWENAPTQYDPAHPSPAIDRVPYKNIGLILDHFWAFHSNYNALSFKVDHTGRSLSFLANYTWAHSLDNKSGTTGINAEWADESV
jgi:TonB dependent receptor